MSFRREVAPILVTRCLICHGPMKPRGTYRVDTFQRLLQAGDSRLAPIVAGDPQRSQLYRLLTQANPSVRMPQDDDPLPARQLDLIARWVREGARFDGDDPHQPLAQLVPRPAPLSAPAVYRQPVPILALAFAPDGNQLVAGGYHEVTTWDAGSGRLVRRLGGLAQQVTALDFSRDGKWLAVAAGTPGQVGEASLIAWPPGSPSARGGGEGGGQLLARFRDSALAARFSPDGSRLAVAGADHVVRVFEVATRRELVRAEVHADWVQALAWSPDGRWLATASRDRTVRVLDAVDGSVEVSYAGHGAPVQTVAFSDDGKSVVSGGRDREVHVWQAADAKPVSEFRGLGEAVLRLIVRGDEMVVALANRTVRVVSRSQPTPVRTLEVDDWPHSLALHEASGRLAVGGQSGRISVWDRQDTRLLRFLAAPGLQ